MHRRKGRTSEASILRSRRPTSMSMRRTQDTGNGQRCQQALRRKRREHMREKPSWNMPDQTVGKWCKTCAPPGAVDVTHRRCAGKDGNTCTKQPCWNMPDQTVGKWCKQCAPPGAVDVTNRRCAGKDGNTCVDTTLLEHARPDHWQMV